MTDCLVLQPIAPAGLDRLRAAGLSVHAAAAPDAPAARAALREARAVVTRNHGLSAAEIGAARRLEVIVSHGTGVDAIALDAAAARGIPVLNTPGTNARSVAEHTMALTLACARSLAPADRHLRAGDFAVRDRLAIVDLAGRQLGLVGFGRIARLVAGLARGFGMTVSAVSERVPAAEIAAEGVAPAADLDSLLGASDVVSLHGLPGPSPVLDEARLARLRPGAILVNTARGALVDEAALAGALRDGRLAAAALDVFAEEPLPPDSPLMDCPNLLLTPHIGGASRDALERTALAAAEAVIAALGAGPSGERQA